MWYNHRYDLIRRDTHVGKPIKLPCLNLMKPSHVCRRTHTNTLNNYTHFLRLTDTNFFSPTIHIHTYKSFGDDDNVFNSNYDNNDDQ